MAGKSISVPFIAGPFPWAKYAELSWFPWRLARRSQGRIYDRDGLVLEVLGYATDPQPCAGTAHARRLVRRVRSGRIRGGRTARRPAARGEIGWRRERVIALRPDEVDLGFQVYLRRFRRKLDPGSGMPSHYSSQVDLLDRSEPPQPLHESVLVTLNAPVDVADPRTGRSWRLFQASFSGPWKPGDVEFDQLAAQDPSRGQIYLSQLSANYDPGRGAKYLGSLMIVAGIVMVYCLRRTSPHASSLRGGE